MNDEKTGRADVGPEAMSRRRALAVAAGAAAVVMTRGEDVEAELMSDEENRRFDAVIVGGGPAGLSAALVLGRACRRVLLCDAGPGRNAPAAAVHGFLSRDGTPPAELRRIAREQLKPYDVVIHDGAAVDVRKAAGGFEVTLDGDGGRVACRKLILATGMVDDLPEIPGLKAFWGAGVILCPYCHGWEFRGRPWGFMAAPEHVVESATLLLGWTRRLTFLAHGDPVDAELRDWLTARGVAVAEGRVERLEGADGVLTGARIEGGDRLDLSVLQLRAPFRQASRLPVALGCEIVAEGPTAGMVRTDPMGATSVEGLYVAGDAAAGPPSVASAAAEGAVAAAMANRAMLIEDAAALGPAPEPARPA